MFKIVVVLYSVSNLLSLGLESKFKRNAKFIEKLPAYLF